MRKVLPLLLAALLLIGAVCVAFPASAAREGTAKIYYVAPRSGSTVNLRAEATKNSKLLVQIPWGTELALVDITRDKVWGYTSYKQYEGWIMMTYLSKTKPKAKDDPFKKADETLHSINAEFNYMQKNPLSKPYTVIVSTAKTNTLYHLRWAPYTSAVAVRSDVVNGETFTVISEGRSWLQVLDPKTGRAAFIVKSITQVWEDPEAAGNGNA